jgi:GT2 family glycosyltransferase
VTENPQAGLLSIVIPNWNGLRFLQTCLDALLRQTYLSLEIIIVDNASEDGSQAFIQAQYPIVRLIALPENRGFTGACNAGMAVARGEFICLLNNDTEVEPGWAAAVIDAFSRAPDIGSVASRMMLFDRRSVFHTAGDYFTTDGRPGNRGVWQENTGQFDDEAYVFSACGGSSTYRRAMLDQIGLLDDDFFFLMEDVDLGWRAQLAGWRCLYTPHAVVYHHLSATGGGATASFYDGRNTLILLAKNYPADLWRKHRGAILRRQWRIAREALAAWRGKAARARLRGMLAGLVAVPRQMKKRRQIQAGRRISLQALEAVLTHPDADTAPKATQS